MDANIAGWILEFLLRKPIEESVVTSLFSLLPLPDNDLRLKKTILLRRISSEISKGSVSENILDLIEIMEEINHIEGIAISDSMKAAYCTVAVECTVKFLRENSNQCGDYFDAVKRIWKDRIHDMVIWEKSGLVSDQLKDSRDEIEATVWNTSVCKNVLLKDTLNDALKSVRSFVEEENVQMGPPFLEFAAQTMNEMGKQVQDLDNVFIADQVEQGAAVLPDTCENLVVNSRVDSGDIAGEMVMDSPTENTEELMLRSSSAIDVRKGSTLLTENHVVIQSRCSTEGGIHGASNETAIGMGLSDTKHDCLSTPEVQRIQEALKSSTMNLQAVVEDPLPEALHIAENLLSEKEREKKNDLPLEENQYVPKPSVEVGVEAAQVNKSNIGNQCSRHENDKPGPSLMARNSTACTYEWGDDSIEASSDDLLDHPEKFHLPSPRKRTVSPLKTHKLKKFTRRRKIKKWSPLEEETLRIAVQKFGRGNWKFILSSYQGIFEERTEVDLKDKWRNMIK